MIGKYSNVNFYRLLKDKKKIKMMFIFNFMIDLLLKIINYVYS